MKKTAFLILCFLVMVFSGLPTSRAEDAIVLTVRPELLAKKIHSPQTAVSIRDPFSWPTDAPENLLFQEKAAAAQAERLKTAFGNIRLGAILWNKKSPRAIINDIVVGEKEKTMGVFVEKINKDSVILRQKDMLYELTFGQKTINFESGD
jgi:hypothetical protein